MELTMIWRINESFMMWNTKIDSRKVMNTIFQRNHFLASKLLPSMDSNLSIQKHPFEWTKERIKIVEQLTESSYEQYNVLGNKFAAKIV